VFLRSQDVNAELEQIWEGMLPDNEGFEVKEREVTVGERD